LYCECGTRAQAGGDHNDGWVSSVKEPGGEGPAAGGDSQGGSSVADTVERILKFDDMGLRQEVLRGAYGYGFEEPSVIQQMAITPIARGRDVIAQAQSGTGKTGAFTIGTLQRLDTAIPYTQVLILSPTRELAQQTQEVVSIIGDYLKVTSQASVGGMSMANDLQRLREGVQVVCGTPGRVMDMIQRGALDTSYLRALVIDECDKMLQFGFKEQVSNIFATLPREMQTVVVSATMTPETFEICEKFLRDPVRVIVKQEEVKLDGISQFYVDVQRDEWKLDTLCDLYETLSVSQVRS
jgi:translation initiation factor 4A